MNLSPTVSHLAFVGRVERVDAYMVCFHVSRITGDVVGVRWIGKSGAWEDAPAKERARFVKAFRAMAVAS